MSDKLIVDYHYLTTTLTPSEWLANSGAYIHCIVVIPFEKSPLCVTLSGYSNTYVPLGNLSIKKFVAASRVFS